MSQLFAPLQLGWCAGTILVACYHAWPTLQRFTSVSHVVGGIRETSEQELHLWQKQIGGGEAECKWQWEEQCELRYNSK